MGIERRTSDQNSNVYNTVEYPISHTHQNIANVEAVAEEALLKYPSPQYMEIDIPENFSDENVLIGIKSSEDSLILLGNQGKILHLGSGKVTPCPTFGEGNTIGIRCWPIKGKLENKWINICSITKDGHDLVPKVQVYGTKIDAALVQENKSEPEIRLRTESFKHDKGKTFLYCCF